MSKQSYIYTRGASNVRGKNLCIMVYRMKRNKPYFIGETHVNTASYKGDRVMAYRVISEVDKFPLTGDGYGIDGNIQVSEVGYYVTK